MSRRGFWLSLEGRELFVSFTEFPWFRDASVGQILAVEQPGTGHLHWPLLDIDLAVESIKHPARYPLVSRVRSDVQSQPADARAVRERGPLYRLPRKRRDTSRSL